MRKWLPGASANFEAQCSSVPQLFMTQAVTVLCSLGSPDCHPWVWGLHSLHPLSLYPVASASLRTLRTTEEGCDFSFTGEESEVGRGQVEE
jgi:hypothetical protein